MSDTYLLTLPRELTPDDRLALKEMIGATVRGLLLTDLAVSIDHIAVPVTDMDERDG